MQIQFELKKDHNSINGKDFWLAIPKTNGRIDAKEWGNLQTKIYKLGGGKYYKPKKGFPFYQEEKPDLSSFVDNITSIDSHSTNQPPAFKVGTITRNSNNFQFAVENAKDCRLNRTGLDDSRMDIDDRQVSKDELIQFIKDNPDFKLRYDGQGHFSIGEHYLYIRFIVDGVTDWIDPAKNEYLAENFFIKKFDFGKMPLPSLYKKDETPMTSDVYAKGLNVEFIYEKLIFSGNVLLNQSSVYSIGSKSDAREFFDIIVETEEGLKRHVYNSNFIRLSNTKHLNPIVSFDSNKSIVTLSEFWQKLTSLVSTYHDYKNKARLARKNQNKQSAEKTALKAESEIQRGKEILLSLYQTRPELKEIERTILQESESDQNTRISLWGGMTKEKNQESNRPEVNEIPQREIPSDFSEKSSDKPTQVSSMAETSDKPIQSTMKKTKNASVKDWRELVAQKGTDFASYTADDLKMAAGYEGLGGMANKDDYIKELTLPERVGVLDQFYTPDLLCQKMWGLAYKHGFVAAQSRVLEPSCGTGRFLKFTSEQMKVDAYEPDLYPFVAAKLLFPKVNVVQSKFDSLFFQDSDPRFCRGLKNLPKYDLVIGNPPYREFKSEFSKKEAEETGAFTYDQYFIMRGVDLLKKGGLLVFVIPSSFMMNTLKYNDFKQKLSEKSELVDAYRLPNTVFQNTEVQTDIIVLKRK